LSELVQCFAHAGFCLVAEVFEGGLEQWGDEAGQAFEGEVGGVGYLGSGRHWPEGHGVNGHDGLVLSAKSNELAVHEFIDDVGESRLPAEKCRGVEVGGTNSAFAVLAHGGERAWVPLGGCGEVG